eukprot:8655430-Lingulodinium_polyedra.AAC.1
MFLVAGSQSCDKARCDRPGRRFAGAPEGIAADSTRARAQKAAAARALVMRKERAFDDDQFR